MVSSDLETLNDYLNGEVEKYKEQVEEKNKIIAEMKDAMKTFFGRFVKLDMPFGQPGDTKLIEVIVLKDTFEKEILKYNIVHQALLKAKETIKPIGEAPEDIQRQMQMQRCKTTNDNPHGINNGSDSDTDSDPHSIHNGKE